MRRMLLLFVAALAISAGAQDRPHIVKRFHLYNQTGAIGPITIYTPRHGHGAMFGVNTFMVITAGNGEQGDLCGYLGFTDRVGSTQIRAVTSSCALAGQAGYVEEGTIPIADEGGNPLALEVYGYGNVSGAKYDVGVVVEEL